MKLRITVFAALFAVLLCVCAAAFDTAPVSLYPERAEAEEYTESLDLIQMIKSGSFSGLHPVSAAFIVMSVLFVAAAAFVIITGKKAGK